MNITPLLGILAGATVDFALWVLLLKSVVLLALAWGLNRLLRHVGAAVHHALWTAALIAVLLLPAVSVILPSWSLVLPPLWSWAGTEIFSSQATRPPAPRRLVSLSKPMAGIRHPGGKAMGTIAAQRNWAGGEPAQSPSIATQTPVLPMRKPRDIANWPAGLFLVWLAGAAILLLMRLFGGLAVGRIIRRARRITGGSLAEALERVRGKIHLPRRVALYVSEETAMPVVRGIFRACVVLPAMAGNWPQGRLQSVLTHELGHVKRWDCLTLLLGQVAAAVYWLNPLVWLACRQLRTQCEQACDDLVLAHGTAAVTYAEDLLAVARTRRVPGLLSTAAVPLARPSQLHRRMLAILDGTVARRGLSRRLLLAAGFATLAFTLAFGMLRPVNKAQAATTPAAAKAAKKTMTFTMIDQKTGKPLAGVKVDAYNGRYITKLTDARGQTVLPLPRHKWSYFYIQVHAKGYVPESLSWNMYGEMLEAFPATYTLALPRGTVISGRVVDNHGQPIVGAHVFLFGCKAKQGNIHEKVDVLATVQTGRNGIWRYCGIPAHGVSEIEIGTWDYRYVWYSQDGGFMPIHTFTDLTKFRNGQAVFTLTRGIMVHGVALGPDGKPVAGAQITLGPDQNGTNTAPPMEANAAGQFSFAALPGHLIVLTAQAKGYGPALGLFHIRANSPSVLLRLTAPHTLIGRVVDPAGRPLADASVYTDTWRGCRTLIHHMRTDRQGRFIWRQAPAGQVLVDASAPGYAYALDVPIRTGKINRISLLPFVTVHGTVVDAGTGRPVDKFRVTKGEVRRPTYLPAFASWNPATSREVTGTERFVRTFRTQYGAYAIQIEAKGYRPAAKVFPNNARNIGLHFRLVRAGKITVRVLNPGGTPAIGAKALLVPVDREGIIETGGHYSTMHLDERFHTTGAHGTLTFAPQADGSQTAVYSNAGYAAWSSGHPPKNGLVTLRRWGSIRGRVLLGKRPVAGRVVEANITSPPGPLVAPGGSSSFVRWQGVARTGSKGEFSIPRMPAGEAYVVLLGKHKQTYPVGGGFQEMQARELPQTVTVVSGSTVHVTLGSVGRPVEGTIEVPSALANRHDWYFDLGVAYTSLALPTALQWPMPEIVKRGPFVQRAEWIRKFAATTAGKAIFAKQNRWRTKRFYTFTFLIKSGRTFTVPGVVSGTYRVEITAVRVGQLGVNPNSVVGTVNGTFTVPPIPGGVSDVPLKIPPLKLEMIKPAKSNKNPP